MGPWSEERQLKRAAAISRLLEQPLPRETRKMWQRHLHNLARNETTYNARVREIYKDLGKGIVDYGS